MKLLIIEGTDGAGKTSLWKKLRNEHKDDPRYFFWTLGRVESRIGKTLKEAWADCIANKIKAALTHALAHGIPRKELIIISDRSFIGSSIYGLFKKDSQRLYRGDCIEFLNALEKAFSSIHVLLLTAKSKELRERLLERGDDYITPDEAKLIQTRYMQLLMHLEMIYHRKPNKVTFHFGSEAVTKKAKRELANKIINESI